MSLPKAAMYYAHANAIVPADTAVVTQNVSNTSIGGRTWTIAES